MMILLSFAVAMLVTTVALPPLRKHAAILGLVDVPTLARKVHSGSIPHSGGVAIILGVLAGLISWLPREADSLPLLACMLFITLMGLLDDIRDLGHRAKFLTQILACVALLSIYGGFPNVPFVGLDQAPLVATLGYSAVFLIGVTNAINLSDGLDGLAAGSSLLSLVVLGLFAAQANEMALLVITLSVAGGLAGFLRFNTHPASIFMGDTGSQFLGFTAGALAILILQSDRLPFSPLVPVLLFGLPILDTLSVMVIRKVRGRSMFKADRSHLHHQLLHLGLRHYQVVIVLYVLQAACIAMAYRLRFSEDILLLAAYLGFCTLVLGSILIARLSGWRMGSPQTSGNHDPERRHPIFRRLSWYHENTARSIAPVVGAFFVFGVAQIELQDPTFQTYARVLALAVIIAWFLLHRHIGLLVRAVCYAATALATYGVVFAQSTTIPQLWIDLWVLGIGLALALAIRVTRRSLFHLDSQDYLILLIVCVAPLLMPASIDGVLATRIVIYLAVILYACEYIATKGNRTRWALTAVGSLGIAQLAL